MSKQSKDIDRESGGDSMNNKYYGYSLALPIMIIISAATKK